MDVGDASRPVVPSLHSLCCDIIMTTVINLDNAPYVYHLARNYNMLGLQQRAERFLTDAWAGVAAKHEESQLNEMIGKATVEKMNKLLVETEAQLRRLRIKGEVVDTPPPPPPPPPAAMLQGAAAGGVPSNTGAAPRSAPPAKDVSERPGPKRRFVPPAGEMCGKCGKRVYPAERAQGVTKPFHADCLRCHECNCKLHSHSFERTDEWVLYCKTHFKQQQMLRARGASTSAAVPPSDSPVTTPYGTRNTSGSGCNACGKTVYAQEAMVASCRCAGEHISYTYHKACFRCADCGTSLRLNTFELDASAEPGVILCKAHYLARRRNEPVNAS